MENTCGEICVNTFSSSFKWKIPKFYSMIKNHKAYDSPEFKFCDAKWKVFFYGVWSSSVNDISAKLIKRNCSEWKHHINYEVTIMYGDDIKYSSGNRKHLLFASSCSSGFNGCLKDMQKVPPDGDATLVCTMECDFIAKDTISTAVNIDSHNLLEDMEALFSTGQGSDVTLVVGDRNFPVHRAILGIRSPVFAAMFKHNLREKASGIVTITDFDPDVFHDFLLYLYTAKFKKFSFETVIGLYSAADKYHIQELKKKCVGFLSENLSLDIFFSSVSFAQHHKESSLLEAAARFFAKNLKRILVTASWKTFLIENLETANELLIKAEDLEAFSEEI